jgi:BlaI family transcriptional regulator, penicillinase repressor
MLGKPVREARPTDAELKILTVLWSSGDSTVRTVHEVLTRRRPVQYTTVLKIFQVMTEKGLVHRDEKQRAHVYAANRPAEWTQRHLVGDLLQRGFGDSARSLMVGALSSHRPSREELAELRRFLEDYERGIL